MTDVPVKRRRDVELLLVEHVFLLMVDTKTASWAVPRIVAGALLLDLEHRGCLDRPNGQLVVPACELEHPLLERARAVMAAAPEPRDAKDWVKDLPKQLEPLNEDLARGLVQRGLLVEQPHKRLGLFSSRRLHVVGLALGDELYERLLWAFESGSEPSEEDCLLTALLFPGDLVDMVPKDRVREAQVWLIELCTQWITGTATRVRPAQAAVLRGVTDPPKLARGGGGAVIAPT